MCEHSNMPLLLLTDRLNDKCKKQNKRLTLFKLTDKQRHSSAMGLLLLSPHLSNIDLFLDEQIQHDLEEDEGELGGPQRSGGLFSGT